MTQADAGEVTFRRPDGSPLRQAWQPPVAPRLSMRHLAEELATARSAYPQYDGERVDYDYVLAAIDPELNMGRPSALV